MTSLRVLIATPHRGLVGGVEIYVQSLILGLLESEHQVALLYEQSGTSGQATVDSARVEAWEAGNPDDALRRAHDWRPDVVYLQGLISTRLESALALHFPAVLFAHGYHGTCAVGSKRHTLPRIVTCRRRFGLRCLAMNYARRCGGLSPVTLARRYRHEAERNRLLPELRAVIVASRHMISEYDRHGVRAERLHRVPLPRTVAIDPSAPAPRGPGGRILWLGRATELKGGDRLIRAVSEAAARLGRPLELTMAGRGPALEGWRHLAERLGVSAVFPGWLDGEQRTEVLRAADVLAVPSLWPEPFGLVGVEAGCVGLPAVAYAVGGILDWLEPGVSGELAPGDPPTVTGLVEAIVRALGDPAHHARLRVGAWEMAKYYSMQRHLTALIPILGAAAGGGAQARG